MSKCTFKIQRLPGESWRDCVKRIGLKYGLDHEVLTDFDRNVGAGEPEDEAAFNACWSWDVCELA
jgi:hypothetical protein